MNIQAKAYHLEKQLFLGEIRKKLNSYTLLKREHSFLLYELSEKSYLYIKDYGSVVFINCNINSIKEFISILLNEEKDIEKLPSEEYDIILGDKIEVDFNKITVKDLNEDVAHIIMLNLAQSVGLMNYVNKTSDLHEKTLSFSKELEETGDFRLSRKKMRKFIGKTLNLKNNISENLFVLDTPQLAWSDEDLSALNYKLNDELDIVKRHQSIENSLNVIKENLDLLNDILQHRHSSMLEWIIILLILFEIVQVIIEKII